VSFGWASQRNEPSTLGSTQLLIRPWQLVVVLEFASEPSAVAFEKYLKTGAGRAFSKRHFVQESDSDVNAEE
jgi:hypothetical protein